MLGREVAGCVGEVESNNLYCVGAMPMRTCACNMKACNMKNSSHQLSPACPAQDLSPAYLLLSAVLVTCDSSR